VPVHARCGSTSGPRGRVFEPFGRSWRNTVPATGGHRGFPSLGTGAQNACTSACRPPAR
jgi:hypothetical protein